MTHLGHEQIGDLISLSVLALMFWTMFALELRRTWKWERLGIALTVVTVCLAVSYSAAAFSIVTVDVWTPIVRYAFRAALIVSGVVTIVVLLFDKPPQPPIPPRRHHHAFSHRERKPK